MWEDVWQILTVFFASTVKFGMVGVPLAVGVYHFPFLKSVVVTSTGGITGVYFFLFLSEKLIQLWYRFFPKKHNPNKKNFTFRNKVIVGVKRKFGLIGLSIITPTILSIPLGVFLALRFYKDKKQILVYMVTAVMITSIVISSVRIMDLIQ